jgi:hypothetical protein
MKLISKTLLTLGMVTLVGCSFDSDNDSIPNSMDECPEVAEDKDGFQDSDGCPDPDNDKDGVLDVKDQCPFVPEDRDGFKDTDGCPDKDNDEDGIPDKRDKCANEAEDRDNFQDADGCPDIDNDKDSVLDTQDKCPLDVEDIDGFQDDDGCPDFDNDGDGIKDKFDKCPNEKEVFNGKDDEDGCPDIDAEPLPEETWINITYQTGTADLTFESKQNMDDKIIKQLRSYPKHRIYLYVFLPKVDLEITEYLDLLNARTIAIADYLAEKGIDRKNQIRTRNITEEMFNSKAGTEQDFNQFKRVLFKRK